jgi:hypothetical protein
MSRVSMNVEAAGKVADSLNDIAGELDQRASEIDGILNDAGKDADAPRTARNTARLYGAISEDIRTRITLLQEADRQHWPSGTKNIINGYSLWEVREELVKKYGTGSKIIQTYDQITGGTKSVRQLLRTIVHGPSGPTASPKRPWPSTSSSSWKILSSSRSGRTAAAPGSSDARWGSGAGREPPADRVQPAFPGHKQRGKDWPGLDQLPRRLDQSPEGRREVPRGRKCDRARV